jgi:hypothetical protein
MKKTIVVVGFLGLLASGSWASETFFKKGQKGWKFWDKVDSPAEKWSDSDFDDSAWKEGQAPLGYGDDEIKSTISYGDNKEKKHPAAYFRLEFEVKDHDHQVLYMMVRYDDGARLYLNGTYLGDLNTPKDPPPPGAYTGKSLGPGVLDGYTKFVLQKKGLLVKGNNTFAISVHQGSASSSDLFLDAEFLGISEKEFEALQAAEKKTVTGEEKTDEKKTNTDEEKTEKGDPE